MELNKIYNEDCFDTMRNMTSSNLKIDVVLTSPPYFNAKDSCKFYREDRIANHTALYDEFSGFESEEDYRKWLLELFSFYDSILVKDGVVLFNISYTGTSPHLMWLVVADIINKSNFITADCIIWKKNNALPANMNSNRATRVCEFVFVFCRKSELDTFKTNKIKVGNKYKNLFYNYIEARNNSILDTSVNTLNGATFSEEFVLSLLKNYATIDSVVYDSFMGTGTTACACKKFGCKFIGSEISKAQVEFANSRLLGTIQIKYKTTKKLF